MFFSLSCELWSLNFRVENASQFLSKKGQTRIDLFAFFSMDNPSRDTKKHRSDVRKICQVLADVRERSVQLRKYPVLKTYVAGNCCALKWTKIWGNCSTGGFNLPRLTMV